MSAGIEGVDAMIASLRKLGSRDFIAECAKEAAPLVEAVAKKTAAAGTTPDGKPWAPRKKDGGRALANAAAAVSANAAGTVVRTKLEGVEVYHQKSKGHPREIIPEGGGSGGLPPGYADAITTAATRVFDRAIGGK